MIIRCDRYVLTNPRGEPAQIFPPNAIRPDIAKPCSGLLELLSDSITLLVKCSKCYFTRRADDLEIKALKEKERPTSSKPLVPTTKVKHILLDE